MAPIMSVLACVVACHSSTEPTGIDAVMTRRLSVGETTTCALDAKSAVWCWGQNDRWWEYGASSTTVPASNVPVQAPVPALVGLSGGAGPHMCGIVSGGSAWCWGRDGYGQLGDGTLGNTGNPPLQVAGHASWSSIFVGRLTTCGVSIAGSGYCWGDNQNGEVGADSIPIDAATDVPAPLSGSITFTSIVPGWRHACGIAVGGQAYCWGANDNGQLGIGTVDSATHRDPAPIAGSDHYVQLTAGAQHTCGLTTDGRAMCWGANGTGQLGDGTATNRATPTAVAGGLSFTTIATASGFAGGLTPSIASGTNAHTCALTAAGAAYCWGYNAFGQVGNGTQINQLTPTAVQGSGQFSAIALGGAHTCAMRGNAIWCWGSNVYGQLGIGSNTDVLIPTQVVAPFAVP